MARRSFNRALHPMRVGRCVGCRVLFSGRFPMSRKYCSHECYARQPKPNRVRRVLVPCAVCGVPVSTARTRGSTHRTCSQEHFRQWQRRTKIHLTCQNCGSTFTRSPSASNQKYCCQKCRDLDPSYQAKKNEATARQARTTPNRLEIAGYAMLDSIGEPYERQALLFSKFRVDAFVPGYSLVVQFDGDYWHGSPEIYPTPSARQRRRIALDQSQDAYLAVAGLRVLRLSESMIRKRPADTLASLRAALAPPREIHVPAGSNPPESATPVSP